MIGDLVEKNDDLNTKRAIQTVVVMMDDSFAVESQDLIISARMDAGWSVNNVSICNGVRYITLTKDNGLADLKVLLDSELGTSEEPFFIRIAELVESYKQLSDFMNFEYYSKGKNPFAYVE